MTAPTTTPPGWYPDPDRAGQMRWWDGRYWSPSRENVPPARQPSPRKKAGKHPNVGGLGILAGLVGILVVVMMLTGDKTPSHPPEFYAQAACEQAATYDLKSPSSAHFSSAAIVGRDYTVTDAETYEVRSYVDAENSFGAKLRSSVHCTVTRLPETKQWRVDSVAVS